MKKFAAVVAAGLLSFAVMAPAFAQQSTQAPKGTEGPDVRKNIPFSAS